MLKNDTLKNDTSRIGLYGSAPPPGLFQCLDWMIAMIDDWMIAIVRHC